MHTILKVKNTKRLIFELKPVTFLLEKFEVMNRTYISTSRRKIMIFETAAPFVGSKLKCFFRFKRRLVNEKIHSIQTIFSYFHKTK